MSWALWLTAGFVLGVLTGIPIGKKKRSSKRAVVVPIQCANCEQFSTVIVPRGVVLRGHETHCVECGVQLTLRGSFSYAYRQGDYQETDIRTIKEIV